MADSSWVPRGVWASAASPCTPSTTWTIAPGSFRAPPRRPLHMSQNREVHLFSEWALYWDLSKKARKCHGKNSHPHRWLKTSFYGGRCNSWTSWTLRPLTLPLARFSLRSRHPTWHGPWRGYLRHEARCSRLFCTVFGHWTWARAPGASSSNSGTH